MNRSAVSPQTRLGGISFLLCGGLYLLKSVLDLRVGDPPSTGSGILAWRSSHEVALAWIDELLLAATVLLIPAIIALYRTLGGARRPWVGFGCGLYAAVVPTLLATGIVHGRLVFPVYDLTTVHDPASAQLVASLYFGGMHVVNLLLAAATILLGLAMRRGMFGPAVGAIGVVAGVAQLGVGYPWLFTPAVVLGMQAILVAWFVLTGWRLAWRPMGATPAEEVAALGR